MQFRAIKLVLTFLIAFSWHIRSGRGRTRWSVGRGVSWHGREEPCNCCQQFKLIQTRWWIDWWLAACTALQIKHPGRHRDRERERERFWTTYICYYTRTANRLYWDVNLKGKKVLMSGHSHDLDSRDWSNVADIITRNICHLTCQLWRLSAR